MGGVRTMQIQQWIKLLSLNSFKLILYQNRVYDVHVCVCVMTNANVNFWKNQKYQKTTTTRHHDKPFIIKYVKYIAIFLRCDEQKEEKQTHHVWKVIFPFTHYVCVVCLCFILFYFFFFVFIFYLRSYDRFRYPWNVIVFVYSSSTLVLYDVYFVEFIVCHSVCQRDKNWR